MRVLSAILGFLLTLPSAANAVAGDTDYESLTQKVRKSVYVYHHKRGISLNGPETKSLLVQSFLGQLVKTPLAELEPHLFFACGMPDLYDSDTINLNFDGDIKVNRSDVFLYARKHDLRARFPEKEGMSSKRRRKVDKKKMKYFRDHWNRNEYLPQTATKELGEVNPWVSDAALLSKIRQKCEAAMDVAIQPHKEPFSKFVQDTVLSQVETTVK